MHRIDTETAQKDKPGAGKNGFIHGNPQTGTPATDLDGEYFDMLQEELCSMVEASGASLEKARHDQLLTVLRALLLNHKNPFSDIKSDGMVKTALGNLSLREGSALPVDVSVPWPSATPSIGWLRYNGAAFSAEEYPELAKAYPANKLPDLCGEFIRGWDDGRGVDSRRAVLPTQEPTVGAFYMELAIVSGILSGSGVKFTDSVGIGSTSSNITVSDGNNQSVSGTVAVNPADTRPRNITLNYIVRAA